MLINQGVRSRFNINQYPNIVEDITLQRVGKVSFCRYVNISVCLSASALISDSSVTATTTFYQVQAKCKGVATPKYP